MSDRGSPRHAPGVTEVMLVALAIVGVVALAVVVTQLLPNDIEDLVYRTPIAIGVLIGGTAIVLWRISRRQRT